MINEALGILAGEIVTVLDEGRKKPDRRSELARVVEESEEIVDSSLSFLARQGSVRTRIQEQEVDIFHRRAN